jgi:hypothetical protein
MSKKPFHKVFCAVALAVAKTKVLIVQIILLQF